MFEDLCKVFRILSGPDSLISFFLYRLSRNLIDFNMPYVIYLDLLCLYLLNLKNFPFMFFFLAVSIASSMTL